MVADPDYRDAVIAGGAYIFHPIFGGSPVYLRFILKNGQQPAKLSICQLKRAILI